MVLSKPVLIGVAVIAVLASFAVLSFYPLPNQYNVAVAVNVLDVSFGLGSDFQITGVSGSTLGHSTVINWGVAGIAWFTVQATFSMTVCVGGSNHCTTKQESTWFQSIPFVNGQQLTASDTFDIGYVPGGLADITVNLYQNGNSVATGSATMCVGC